VVGGMDGEENTLIEGEGEGQWALDSELGKGITFEM